MAHARLRLMQFNNADEGVNCPSPQAEQEPHSEALSDSDLLIEFIEQLIAKKRTSKQGACGIARPRQGEGWKRGGQPTAC